MHAFCRDRITAPKRLKEEMSYGQMEALATLLAQWVAEGGDALTLEDKQYLLKTSYGLMNLAKEVGEEWESPQNGRPSLTSVLGKLAETKKL